MIKNSSMCTSCSSQLVIIYGCLQKYFVQFSTFSHQNRTEENNWSIRILPHFVEMVRKLIQEMNGGKFFAQAKLTSFWLQNAFKTPRDIWSNDIMMYNNTTWVEPECGSQSIAMDDKTMLDTHVWVPAIIPPTLLSLLAVNKWPCPVTSYHTFDPHSCTTCKKNSEKTQE